MKLVDILAKGLTKWPVVDGVVPNYIVQDSDGELFSTVVAPCYGGSGVWYRNPDHYECGYFDVYLDLAEDYQTAVITREEWESARVRLAKSTELVDEQLPPIGSYCKLTEETLLASESEALRLPAGTLVEVGGYAKFNGGGYVCVICTEDGFTGTLIPECLELAEGNQSELDEIERLYSEGGPAAVYDAGYRKVENSND